MTFKEWVESQGTHVCSSCVKAWVQQDLNYGELVDTNLQLQRVIDEIYANTQSGTKGLSRDEQEKQLTIALRAVGDALKTLTLHEG